MRNAGGNNFGNCFLEKNAYIQISSLLQVERKPQTYPPIPCFCSFFLFLFLIHTCPHHTSPCSLCPLPLTEKSAAVILREQPADWSHQHCQELVSRSSGPTPGPLNPNLPFNKTTWWLLCTSAGKALLRPEAGASKFQLTYHSSTRSGQWETRTGSLRVLGLYGVSPVSTVQCNIHTMDSETNLLMFSVFMSLSSSSEQDRILVTVRIWL